MERMRENQIWSELLFSPLGGKKQGSGSLGSVWTVSSSRPLCSTPPEGMQPNACEKRYRRVASAGFVSANQPL